MIADAAREASVGQGSTIGSRLSSRRRPGIQIQLTVEDAKEQSPSAGS